MVTCTKWGFYEHVGNTWIMSTVGLRTKNCKYLIFSFFLLQFYFLFRYNFHRVQWVNILMNLWTHIHAHRWNHNPYRDGAFLIHQQKLPQVPSHSSDLIPEILNFHVSLNSSRVNPVRAPLAAYFKHLISPLWSQEITNLFAAYPQETSPSHWPLLSTLGPLTHAMTTFSMWSVGLLFTF